jgi:hypothetical protein
VVGLLLVSMALVSGLTVAGSAAASSVPSSAPLPFFVTNVQSTNWAGYAVTGAAHSVTRVSGSWVEPTVVGSCPSGARYSSFWIGIDGYSSSTVEQTGTDVDCTGGHASYYAWYEFYPAGSVSIGSVAVSDGDHISASVSFSTSFTVKLTDVTSGKSFSITKSVSGAQRSSAEWIAESPEICSSTCKLASLTDFGTVHFSNGRATVSGTSGAIGSFSSVDKITMTNSGGTITRASPSALNTAGTSFSIRWKHT